MRPSTTTTRLCNGLRRLAQRPHVPRACAHRLLAAAFSAGPPARAESTVNAGEIAHFSRLSSLWWDEQGEFSFLHKMNPVRMQFIRDKIVEMRREDSDNSADVSTSLAGLDILDVGCGGGLLSESLARLGANTLGIDASASNIAIASLHASADPALAPAAPEQRTRRGALRYMHTSVEALLAARGPAQFDAVCSMEVLEHVDNPRAFLASCAALVKPGGHLFLSTIARTPLAYGLTILAAEHALGLVARGTHTYAKFVRPDELRAFFLRDAAVASPAPWISRLPASRAEAETRGMVWLPWAGAWALVPRGAPGAGVWGEACNYLFWVRRPRE